MTEAHLLLAELDATELLLRSLAIESLDYRGVIGVERRAHEICGALLSALESGRPMAQPLPAPGKAGVSNAPRSATPAPVSRAPVSVSAAPASASAEIDDLPDDPTDETPHSSGEVLLQWRESGQVTASDPRAAARIEEEDPTIASGGQLQAVAQAADRAQASLAAPAVIGADGAFGSDDFQTDADLVLPDLEAEAEPAELSELPGREAEPSWVQDTSWQRPSYLEEEQEESAPSAGARTAAPASSGSDPWAHLVSFETPTSDVEDEPVYAGSDLADESSIHDDPWEEQRRMERERGNAPAASPVAALAARSAYPSSAPVASAPPPVAVPPARSDLALDNEPAFDSFDDLELEPVGSPPGAGTLGDLFEDDAHATVIASAADLQRPPAPPPPRPAPLARSATPAPAPTARAAAPVRGGTPIGGTAGLYGSSAAVPTIRDSDEARPRAAAIQLNAGGGAKVLGAEEEEEPIEIGEASADELDDDDDGGGFSLKVQEHEESEEEEEEYEEEDEDEEEEPPAPPPPAAPRGPSAQEIRAMLDAAQAAVQSGNLQQGANLYSDLLDTEPDNLEGHVARGRLYLDLGDYSRAMSDFAVAEDIAPSNPEPQVAIGDLYFARKDYRKAIDYFDLALQLSPNHAMAFCRRGISHYYRKNYQDAVVDLEKAKKLDPDIANIQTYISMAKKKIGGK